LIKVKKKIGVGVIGLGIGEKHVESYLADDRCVIKKVCDRDKTKINEFLLRYPNLDITENSEDILEAPDIDIVSIASYDNFHSKQIIQALTNKKHVFVEKPICLNSRELECIVAASNANSELQLTSNLILRRSPRFIKLQEMIKNNHFGKLYYIEGDYNYGRLHKITEGWRGDLPYYSVMHGGGIHIIDLLCWITGDKVIEVTAMGTDIATQNTKFKYHDTVVGLLRFNSGMIGKITANFACVYPHYHNLSLYGTESSFIQNHTSGAVIYETNDPSESPVRVNDPYPGVVKGDMIPDFITSIIEQREPSVSKKEVFDAMSVSLAIEKSNNSKESVKVDYF
jgi:predicted dehydrogenase